MWALDSQSMGDGLVITNRTTELGNGTCLSALTFQAKEKTLASHGVGGTFFGQTLLGVEGEHLSVTFFT